MFQNTPVVFSSEVTGQKITLQTGLLAKQATASVLASIGQTTVSCSVVVGAETGADFFPLQVIYEERLYASGKIKGSRFVKREGKPSDNAILTGRLIDRSIRSLFPDTLRNEIQVIVTVLSLDQINPPDIVSILAASSAISLCGIKQFAGPVSAVRIGIDLEKDQYAINPNYDILKNNLLDLVVAGNGDNIVMLEAGCGIIEENIIQQALEISNYYLKELNQFQHDFLSLAKDAGFVKNTPIVDKNTPKIVEVFFEQFHALLENILFSHKEKGVKNREIKTFKNNLFSELENLQKELENGKNVKKYSLNLEKLKLVLASFEVGFDKLCKKIIEKNVLHKNRRIDGRKLNETRKIECQIDCLPKVHASSLFNRGETQVLNILTLGTSSDSQILDDMENFEEEKKRYIHHYNFPSYSVGETGRYAGPGRREIGHGALAERAILPVLPSEEDFPYTIRVVSECFGSNGSTSMASTCASCLSLMAGGVPISDMVAGVAMGLIVEKWHQNTDLINVNLETKRLLLTPISETYAKEILKTYNKEVTKFLTASPFKNEEEVVNFLNFCKTEAENKNLLTLNILDKNQNFLGMVDLHNIETGFPEVSVWIRQEAWGQEIAIEAVEAVLKYAKKNLNYGHIKYIFDERNINSAKISEKLGFVANHYYTLQKKEDNQIMSVLETRFFNGGKKQNYKLLTDIQGLEDHLGGMDFKITGTKDGITAIQLDNKEAGLTVEILKDAIEKSKEARLHILNIMQNTIKNPRKNISKDAPRVEKLQIPVEKVGDVIGPGGKTIKSIIAKTEVQIDIEDDGKTLIYGKNGENVLMAKNIILDLTQDLTIGTQFSGTVFRIENYGAFVKIGQQKEGMIHISSISKDRNKNATDFFKIGDNVKVYVKEINDRGQIRLGLAT